MRELLTKLVSLKSRLEHKQKNIIIFAELAHKNGDLYDQYYQSGRHFEVEKIIMELEKILNDSKSRSDSEANE